eukprot:12999778-Ditylum_brightwellii.AAC.1
MDWMDAKGFGGIPGEYLHKKKTGTSDRTKVAHFFNPMVAVKTVEAVTETITDAHLNDVGVGHTNVRKFQY